MSTSNPPNEYLQSDFRLSNHWSKKEAFVWQCRVREIMARLYTRVLFIQRAKNES
ncbi:hypothetical protein AWB76_07043 [Caballeronia temeraria]|uniref:Uncharacterized protein n=1 Tax=Caballeronia temeraria TaxID=1777137 RepID=A0A158DJ34_9BURK|nr:hypothetical protein AWB76_07043 [Caballeronia temeraria]